MWGQRLNAESEKKNCKNLELKNGLKRREKWRKYLEVRARVADYGDEATPSTLISSSDNGDGNSNEQ